MISAGEFRNGVSFEQDGQVLQVVEFQHVKPGKGAAFVRTKTKNVITGSVVETSYNPTAKFPQAFIERKDVTYSYDRVLYISKHLVHMQPVKLILLLFLLVWLVHSLHRSKRRTLHLHNK